MKFHFLSDVFIRPVLSCTKAKSIIFPVCFILNVSIACIKSSITFRKISMLLRLKSVRRAQLRFRSASSPLCTFTLGSKIPRQVFRHQSRAFALKSIRRAQLRFRSASSPLCTFTLGSKIPRQVFRHQSRAFALCKNRNRTQEECKHSSWVLFLFLRTAHCHHESSNFPVYNW